MGDGRAFRYEHRRQRLLGRRHFVRRLLLHFTLAAGIVLASLLAGMAGYAHFEQLSWLDAFLNAAMLLGGMGPVESPRTDAGKLFAGLYALFAGLVFLVVAGILLGPVVHRIMHRLHLEEEGPGSS
jgi:hypothetical protein